MTKPLLLATCLAITMMAGCLNNGDGDDEMGLQAVSAAAIEEGTYYQFNHRGGQLGFTTYGGATAVFDLFDGSDARVGRLSLGDGGFAEEVNMQQPAGAFVLFLAELQPRQSESQDGSMSATVTLGEYGLRVTTAGDKVERFVPLGLQFERHQLVSRPIENMQDDNNPLPFIEGSEGGSPLDESLDVILRRAPSDLRVLVAGEADDLVVRVRGSGGLVYEADDSFDRRIASLTELDGTFYPENSRDGTLSIDIDSSRQHGPIVLEAVSFSRYIPSSTDGARITQPEFAGQGVEFTYGEVGQMPIRIELSSKANYIYAWTEDVVPEGGADPDCEPGEPCSGTLRTAEPIVAWVVFYDPQDNRMGTFRVESGQRLQLPVSEGGNYVAVVKKGPIFLGTDVAPRDFEMHPLEVQAHALGAAPGGADEYGQAGGNVSVPGTPYAVRGDRSPSSTNGGGLPMFFGQSCPDAGNLWLEIDGETLGFWGDVGDGLDRADLYLETKGLRYIVDGFDGSCGQNQLIVQTYHR